ncbi:hypothetical protein HQ45_07970 [Porphyromonas crevioricanis]|uniref:Uncharacterized protein n=1 Tax=Porphyromonas crevioricanis JCM 15906 TaxID=1305617 RepID=T1CSL9_9PORP|nr:hypothetical protein [Porphyromonas crevioricanis]KGN89115.1 hypothetical protein HQ45_07970 [Porphyromonas crevioricanis]GAD06158.1 hypothetical protein PORCRE_1880 [Porphyromonas crevioricanis JCM 15906]SKA07183.1 hypothetical protein SAMN02745203_01780 [Porphyromonas crevioricanis]
MKYDIKPFIGVGNLKFGMKRDTINRTILNSLTFDSVENKNVENDELSTNDYFENGLVLGYLNTSFLLKYIVLSDSCEAFFEGVDLLSMSYSESLTYMKKFDSNIKEEEYMGFTTYKYGIAVYAPEGTENPDCYIEAVTIGEKGYFHPTR